MFCLYCGHICDYDPSQFCINCQNKIEENNKHALLMYLLKESYRFVPEIWLRKRIEELFEKEGRYLNEDKSAYTGRLM